MAKFSVDGEDDEGTSSSLGHRFKRQRSLSPDTSPEPMIRRRFSDSGSDDNEEDDDHFEIDAEEEEEEDDQNVTDHDDLEDIEEDYESDRPPPHIPEYEEDEDLTAYVHNRTVAPTSLASGSTAVKAVASQRARDSAGTSRDGSLTVTLVDPDVFDCSICFNPLCAPVYQCENGHIACSACCTKIRNKCPSCSWPIGYNRCRAIEKVLESVKISCLNSKYGCNETLSYSKKSEHEKICLHAPCSCPYNGCSFLGSSKQLSAHFRSKHAGPATGFKYSSPFSIFIKASASFLILEEVEGTLFIISSIISTYGNIVTVSCIGPSSNERFKYDVTVTSEGSTLKLESLTKISQGEQDQNYEKGGFLLIPCDFFGSDGQATLKMCIWRRGSVRNALLRREIVI